jgi:hypothetical protein
VTGQPVTNARFRERACRVSPGGVNSPVRAFRGVGGTPYFVARGAGAYVWDVEGARYLDYVQSYGASVLGHAHPKVIEAIRQAAGPRDDLRGAHRAARCCWPRTICERVPGCQVLRLVSSGTEADHDRGQAGPRRHRPGPGRPVLGLLPRPQRRAAGRRGQRGGHPRAAGLGRSARWAVAETWWRLTTACPRSATTWLPSSWSRSPPTWASSPPEPGFLEGLRAGMRPGGGPADLR